ncbi:MAG: hypothetical protein QM586_03950 [Xenophilus sp.]
MRVFVLVLAIILLPLRGWMSGAMATESVPVPAPSAAAAASEAMPHCHEAGAPAHRSGRDAPDSVPHHAQCSLCQLCHAVAMAGDVPAAPAAPVQVRLHAPVQRFTSALPQQADKPPIS